MKQSGWSIEQYIDAANILFIKQHAKPFKYKSYMAILVDLLKFSLDPIIVDKKVVDGDGGMVVRGSNPIMSVQGANEERPMGRKKAKKRNSNSTLNGTSNDTSEASRMINALERKAALFATIHPQRSFRKQASLYLKMGDKEKAQQCMTLLEEDQHKCASVPTTINVPPFYDDESAGSSGDKTNDSRFTTTSKDDDNNNDNDDGNDNNDGKEFDAMFRTSRSHFQRLRNEISALEHPLFCPSTR